MIKNLEFSKLQFLEIEKIFLIEKTPLFLKFLLV